MTFNERALANKIARLQRGVEASRRFVLQDWMGIEYKRRLYGGWVRPRDGEVAPPHTKALAFHEGSKALFCPNCWSHVGQVGKSESETWDCSVCGTENITLWTGPHAAKMFMSLNLMGGNRSSKTHTGITEYAAWILGYRPWDGTLTAPPGKGRTRLIVCQSLTKSAEQVICPYFEERLDAHIAEKVKNSNKTVSYYVMKETGDRVHIMSDEQYTKASGTNPFEGPHFFDVYRDEPWLEGVRTAVQRGLTFGAAQGWGRECAAMTPLHSAYVKNDIYDKAVCNGGDRKDVFVMDMSIWDNPGHSREDIERFLDEVPAEEREAREHGRFLSMAGRIYPQFDATTHVIDDQKWDPLITRESALTDNPVPSSWPIVMAVDPHDRKPWAMGWYAVSPHGDLICVREWPTDPYSKMTGKSDFGYPQYAAVIDEIEAGIPGGPKRVLWRFMDPNMGRRGTVADFGDSMADAMAAHGLYFQTEVNDSLEAGHAAVRTLLSYDTSKPITQLNRPHLLFLSRCRNHIWSIGVYTNKEWVDKEKAPQDKPKEPGKDHMDTTRYAAMGECYYMDWRTAWDDGRREEDFLQSVSESQY